MFLGSGFVASSGTSMEVDGTLASVSLHTCTSGTNKLVVFRKAGVYAPTYSWFSAQLIPFEDLVPEKVTSNQIKSSEISYGVESYKLESINVDYVSKYVRFLILSSSDKSQTLSTVSPFAIYKGITGIGGEPKAVRKLKSGDFLIETFTSTQTKSFLLAETLLDIPISVIPHKNLNSVRGVISETELLTASDSDILEGFASQGVIHAHRIHIRHIILTFNKTELPKYVIAGYLHCRIRPYVPNPTRCYKCQRFGHSKVACRGKQSKKANQYEQQKNSHKRLFCSVFKTTVSTLTDDNICRVTRPKKKRSNQISDIVQSNENAATSSTHFNNSDNTLAQVKPRIPCSSPQSESMLTDNSVSDDSDTDNCIDYDPEETIEDIPHDFRTRQPSISHVRRISIRRDGQLLNTKHPILTFDSAKLPEHIKAGYMRLSVRAYIPNPLRCFQCQRFGHSKTSCRGTLTCARCAEVGHESTDCTRAENKKSSSAPSVQKNPDISISKPPDSVVRASPPISASPSVAPVSEEALASPDFTDFKLVTNKKKLKRDSPSKTNNSIAKAEKISKFYTSSRREVLNTIPTKDNIRTHQAALKPFETKKPTSVDTQLLPMAVLPPLEKTVLQSRESDADAEMSSSLSEEDVLEYDMSEDLEDSPAVNSPPPSSKPQKGEKYKNR
ncbi:hypothetical protein AVEN_274502-1 [Araneus ventricosus]|uniref:CCHC-type domain-containing protein n=1 Tax=Araneus ventricosus TaxID=182803 RepID=A0A4Y2V7G1_ARAVE|nr:hypothetical protein AVEN_274502-1 [Araneus ventricosus]